MTNELPSNDHTVTVKYAVEIELTYTGAGDVPATVKSEDSPTDNKMADLIRDAIYSGTSWVYYGDIHVSVVKR